MVSPGVCSEDGLIPSDPDDEDYAYVSLPGFSCFVQFASVLLSAKDDASSKVDFCPYIHASSLAVSVLYCIVFQQTARVGA